MRNRLDSRTLLLCVTLLLLPLVSSLSWKFWNIFQSNPLLADNPSTKTNSKRISHQAASDRHQDVLPDNAAWFDTDGTPLFYSAWRVQPNDGHVSPEPTIRSSLVKHGARVACWPSSGGVWIKQADIVDMEFLGLDRFQDTPRQFNQTAEDVFCTKLKMSGADWWELPPAFDGKRGHLGSEKFACETLETCFTPDVKNPFLLAWPETSTTTCYISTTQAEEVGGELLGGYRNAMDMEERCDVIMSLGGKMCYCKAQCPEIEDLNWSFRDPGPRGCDSAPMYVDLDALDAQFDPKPTRDVVRWANKYCERNGWKKV